MAALATDQFDASDVPAVDPAALNIAFRHLILEGRGLALLKGLTEEEIRGVETVIWAAFPNEAQTRLATALRFRALLGAFGARRLKEAVLLNGFKAIQIAVSEAARQRLNAHYGFRQQHFVMALSGNATRPAVVSHSDLDLQRAA
jgi:hypothetical protein